ncbi:aminotransferase class V-fold PLP-dependent enzyme [Amycolatopsis saalfeldensis]|uniref:Selenocysteine lyase/Cysteine desulfurase n=1 Tax=Amycolatopsis saalfeldensis TaxID=394193 RepID=A0A1H8XXP2_9PSEU|nr:aminotransferase class V-fold PLP-dependent enzyme [Amycolatopsis saalfeldensis]SEP44567.1 Selenocysteine lyase/Cysteine desulfurase [Amycolatopsis saalfeldensis]
MGDLIRRLSGGPSAGYFDTASIGLVPREVRQAVADCYDAMGLGTRGALRWRPVTERARETFAAEFGVTADDIGFMASTGEALNAFAHAVPWRPGDEVLVLSDEFPTVRLPWLELGDEVTLAEVPPLAGDDRLGALLAAIGPRTRVVAVSQVSSFTGTTIDLDVLGAACARAGAMLVCDGAQAAGAVPVELSGVDFYVATGYKWLLAGFGVAVVIAKRESLDRLKPSLLGHGNPPPSAKLSYGHLNLPGVYALEAASAVRRAIGFPEIQVRVAELAQRIRAETAELGLLPVASAARTGGIVSLAGLPDVPAAVDRLAGSGIAVASRGGRLRISPYLHTTDADVDHLLAELSAVR